MYTIGILQVLNIARVFFFMLLIKSEIDRKKKKNNKNSLASSIYLSSTTPWNFYESHIISSWYFYLNFFFIRFPIRNSFEFFHQAEYLFESNPEGRAFQPDYTERLNFITTAVQQLQKDGFLQSCASSSSSSSLDYCIYELLSIASTDDDKCEGEKFILGTENDVSS